VLKQIDDITLSHPGEKIVVFSQVRGFLSKLETPLENAFGKFAVGHLHKSSSPASRIELLRKFKETDEMVRAFSYTQKIILVYLKTGLDVPLTSANHVIISDSWNGTSTSNPS
jgi:SNF2 family DNA or RNA helicase